MRKFFHLTVFFTFSCLLTKAQLISHDPALVIAQKMKDSLALNNTQKDQILSINFWLNDKKRAIWQQFNHPDSIQIHLQQIENKRDTLYKAIITAQQFLLYVEKKPKILVAP